jgi:hypothetical protein
MLGESLLAGSRPPEAQSDTAPGESTRATAEEPTKMDRDHQIHLDAHAYAEDLGVSLQEADRRLDLQVARF